MNPYQAIREEKEGREKTRNVCPPTLGMRAASYECRSPTFCSIVVTLTSIKHEGYYHSPTEGDTESVSYTVAVMGFEPRSLCMNLLAPGKLPLIVQVSTQGHLLWKPS